jgi:cytidylate kinase
MRKGTTFKAAKRAIQFGDNESASFVLHAMGHDVADPAYFDLVVNTETYMRESALSLVLMAYFAKFGHWPLTARGLIAGRLPGLAPALTTMGP